MSDSPFADAPHGWVGNWSPGIGDPTLAGWLTVGLYFAAAWACHRVGHDRSWALPRAETVLFRLLTLVLVVLGINKQLDLQTALTEFGRMLARDEGWYSERQLVQKAFIFGVGLAALTIAAAATLLLRHAPAATHVTLLGGLGLVAFVVIRASSFHHVDLLIRSSWFGVRANWAIEMGSLLLVMMGAAWRAGMLRRRRQAAGALARASDR